MKIPNQHPRVHSLGGRRTIAEYNWQAREIRREYAPKKIRAGIYESRVGGRKYTLRRYGGKWHIDGYGGSFKTMKKAHYEVQTGKVS